MIDHVNRPQCYSAFFAQKNPITVQHKEENKAPAFVKVGTAIGAGICAYGATYLIAKKQSKALNKAINVFNVKFDEKNMLFVASAALLGGMFAGMVLDKQEYRKAKFQEGIHQAVANIICPLALVACLNKGFEKIRPYIKLPSVKETSQIKKVINNSIKIIPNLGVTLAGLVGGVLIGTEIANKINKSSSENFTPRKVKLLDFMYHPDDVAAAFVLADKNGYLQKVVGRIIPPVFMMHGYEAGTKRTNA